MIDETKVPNEEQDTSENPDEELDLDLELDEENQDTSEESKAEDKSEDVDALKARLAESEAKNKQLYARIKKSDKVEKKPTNSQQPDGDLDWKRKIEFITSKGRDLDAEDIDEVIAYAKGKNISYEEALNANVIKSYLKVKQAKAKIANAVPPTSSHSTVVNGKTWSEMNDQERAKNFHKMMKRRG